MRVFWQRGWSLISVLMFLCIFGCSAEVQAQQTAQTTQANLASAKSFSISSEPNSAWLVLARGKAHFVQNEQGLMITFEALDLQLNGSDSGPIFVSSVLISGQEVDAQTGRRTQLMRSERRPVRQTLSADQAIHLEGQAIFMRYPSWHQNNPRFYLTVEFSHANEFGTVDIPTDLHQYQFASDFNSLSNVREAWSEVHMGWIFMVISLVPVIMVSIYFLRRSHKLVIAMMFSGLFAIVWITGLLPSLNAVYVQTWMPTDGYIVDLDVRTVKPNAHNWQHQYLSVVNYEYQVDGQKYLGNKVHPGLTRLRYLESEASDEARVWETAMQQGSKVQVWVDPLNHSNAVLQRDLPIVIKLIALFGTLLLWFAWRFYQRRIVLSQGRSN